MLFCSLKPRNLYFPYTIQLFCQNFLSSANKTYVEHRFFFFGQPDMILIWAAIKFSQNCLAQNVMSLTKQYQKLNNTKKNLPKNRFSSFLMTLLSTWTEQNGFTGKIKKHSILNFPFFRI
jgi:hypothetical protein